MRLSINQSAVSLHWHCWNNQSKVLDALSKAVHASMFEDLTGVVAGKKTVKH